MSSSRANESKRSLKSNTDDSFRDYMRRKIDLQRKQFGLVLPAPLDDNNAPNPSNTTNDRSVQRLSPLSTQTDIDKHQHESAMGNGNTSNPRMEDSPIDESGILSLVGRLQKKHGKGGSRVKLALAKRKKQKTESTLSSSCPIEICGGENRDDDTNDFSENNVSSSSIITESVKMVNIRLDQQQSPTGPEPKEAIGVISTRNRPDLFFLNTVVLINGYTDPPTDSLMRMLQRYGGDVEKYETDRVTHIIAEQLSTAKAKIYKKQRKPIPVVHPRWIVESVEAGRKLPYGNYLLEQVRFHGPHEITMKQFVSSPLHNKQAKVDSGPQMDAVKESSVDLGGMTHFVSSPLHNKQAKVDSSPLMDVVKESSVDLGVMTRTRPQSPPPGVVRTVGNDPTFLESYFASSRLSFIGSFKQRLKPHGHLPPNDDKLAHTHEKGSQRFVLHIDMDYFFAAVAIRNFPQYNDSPVAIGHCIKGNDTGSTSELSTCNYIARKFGVQKGMFLKRARELCPNLIVLPYDYEGYEEVSNQLGNILQQYADNYNGAMEQVSCDEAYLEIYISESEDITKIASELRQKIAEDTQCTASIGISENKLMAKLATNRIKPNGLLLVTDSPSFLQGVSLSDLPGIGSQIGPKLMLSDLKTVQNVLDLGDNDIERERFLQDIVGPARAKKLVSYCKGEDDRSIKPVPRKTIGAECNYGVRFDDKGPFGVDYMISGLAKEVERRMLALNVRGKLCTLKLKERKPNAPPPGKYNGCGHCIDHSKSAPLPSMTNDSSTISKLCMKLVQEIGVAKEEIRGMGIVISKLNNLEDHSSGTVSHWLRRVDPGFSENVDKSCGDNEGSPEHSTFLSADEKIAPSSELRVTESHTIVHQKEKSSLPKKKAAKKTKVSTKPKHGPSKTKKDEGGHFMQTSMTSIMKLASIKSRREEIKYNGEKISFTQLDCLPLELQLEVTNSYNGDTINQFQHSSYSKQNQPNAGSIQPQKNLPTSIYKNPLPAIEQPVQTYKRSLLCYKNSIAPFCTFLDENTSPGEQEVQMVKDFLCICISEHRLDGAVQYLRILKRSQSCWGVLYYTDILEASNAYLFQEEGRVFDKEWLGL